MSIVQLIIMVSLVTILHSLLEVLVTTSNSGQFIRDTQGRFINIVIKNGDTFSSWPGLKDDNINEQPLRDDILVIT